jgi:hypothetical protein
MSRRIYSGVVAVAAAVATFYAFAAPYWDGI